MGVLPPVKPKRIGVGVRLPCQKSSWRRCATGFSPICTCTVWRRRLFGWYVRLLTADVLFRWTSVQCRPGQDEGVSPPAAQVVPVRGRTVGVALRLAPPTHDAGPAGAGFGVDMRHQSTSSDRPTVRARRDQGQTLAVGLCTNPANLWTTSCWSPWPGVRFEDVEEPLDRRVPDPGRTLAGPLVTRSKGR